MRLCHQRKNEKKNKYKMRRINIILEFTDGIIPFEEEGDRDLGDDYNVCLTDNI